MLKKFEIFMELNIGFVAHTHIIGKSFAAFNFSLGDQGQGHVAALGEKRDVAFGGIL